MTVYFLSAQPAALRLDGQYAGVADSFMRRCDVPGGSAPFVELIPRNNRQGINFILDEGFLSSPPEGVEVYFAGGDVCIYAVSYAPKSGRPEVMCQSRFGGHLVTLCNCGGALLCIERADGSADIESVSDGLLTARMEEGEVGANSALFIFSQGHLAAVSATGRLAFNSAVKSYSLGNMLGVTRQLFTCDGAVSECSYSYDGDKFCLSSSRIVQTRPVDQSVRHFALFESVLTHSDCSTFLAEGLKGRAGELSSYLGGFVKVVVPPQKFYRTTGEMYAAGLVYPVSPRVFRVKFYAADMNGGLAENIREVDY